MKVLVTGGCGFIGSNLVRYLLKEGHSVLNVDKLTYAGHLESLNGIEEGANYRFSQTDIVDRQQIRRLLGEFKPDALMHLAAESHVDRSIDGPGEFIRTNVEGTFSLLEAARDYWSELKEGEKGSFRFLHVSTDEVYGSLDAEDHPFSEETPYDPHSPYSASKAASDHLARAWNDTYGLPVIVTNCSNNYGPYQFPEKLIPVVILKALKGESIPVYGKGENVRDWLYVEDHVRALELVVRKGTPGRTYNIGGNNERRNIDLVTDICRLLDQLSPSREKCSHQELINFVADRPGHDLRYAIDATRIKDDLGWIPEEDSESGLAKTVRWYLENLEWCDSVLGGDLELARQGRKGFNS